MVGAGEGPETSVGGIAKLTDDIAAAGAPPHWLGYVAVADVDAATEKAARLGASVKIPPTDIPEVGRFSVIADPQGAVLSIFRGTSEMPEPTGKPGLRQFSWMELITTDHRKALGFYSELFGWTAGPGHDMGPLGVYQIFERKGMETGGMFDKPKEMPAPPMWMYYVSVPDLDASIARLGAGGGKLLMGPHEVPGGDRIAQAADPYGAIFALHEAKKT